MTEERLAVEFEADIVIVDEEIPSEPYDEAAVRQAVQNEIGHTGATVVAIQGWQRV